MKRERIDRSETSIPCLIVFTKPIQVAGLPRKLFYILLAMGVFSIFIFKNLIAGAIVFVVYLILKRINSKDETYLIGFFRMCKKKYLSY